MLLLVCGVEPQEQVSVEIVTGVQQAY